VDAREKWQALQAHLNTARESLRTGDRRAALDEIEAALAIDPEYLAAQTLRERILTLPQADRPSDERPAAESDFQEIQQPPEEHVGREPRRPLVSAEGWARFEQRARQRRLERRLAAARAAIDRRQFLAARAAIAEARELDAHHPELISVGMELEAAQQTPARHSIRGAWLAAAAVFIACVLGASLLENTGMLHSYPMMEIASLVPAVSPTALAEAAGTAGAIGTAGEEPAKIPTALWQDLLTRVVLPRPPASNEAARDRLVSAAPPAEPEPTPLTPTSIGEPDPMMPPSPIVRVAAPPVSLPAPPAPVPAFADDEQLVRRALQQYRSAYEGLDARLAQAVWPAVDEPALARAFEGLQSQNLTFENCNVDLRGPAASAVCRGSARYIPKVGSRAPRVEPRVWNFTLRKLGEDWKIESARADR
jgi:hypothetical protein